LDCGVAERQHLDAFLAYAPPRFASRHSRCLRSKRLLAFSQGHQDCGCAMLGAGLSLFREGNPQLSSATRVAEVFSPTATPVTTVLAAKDRIVVSCDE
jgi:hypothetical protein